ncbi:hypothetical protein [Actinoallomurus sp. CA-150999]|uniref:hypothetical protein n=1 Tax=Actinoallomurus sp. CA-150999 TaxID=3239887 RepID=UPI003D92A1AF
MSEVTELLAELRNGSMSLEEVAERFRQRQWPHRQVASPADAREAFALEEQDPEPFLEGSFDEVAVAYIRHELTKEQYAALANAVAESQQQRPGS